MIKKCNLLLLLTLSLFVYSFFSCVQTCSAQQQAAASQTLTPAENNLPATGSVTKSGTTSNSMPVTSSDVEEFPYIALVLTDDVYVRSGPATPYYPVCKLKKGQDVVVTMVRPGKTNWSRVEPVDGTIAYIAAEFVDLKDGQTGIGVVNSKDVRVRAGSADMAPENAYRVLMLAQTGQEVTILGQVGSFYKIVPPQGCYFWVASEFLKKKSDVSNDELDTLRDAVVDLVTDKQAEELKAPEMSPEVKSQFDLLRELLVKYEGVQGLPLISRDYSVIEKEVKELAEKATATTVKKTVDIMLENIAQGIAAQKRIAESLDQSKDIADAMKQIDDAVVKVLEEISPAADANDVIVVKGQLEPSAVFNSEVSQRYVLMDDQGLISCYVVGENLKSLLGKRVSVSGPVSYDPFGKTRVVTAVKVVELNTSEQK
ncbi:MAG: hypothetical protein JW745_01865 [Sedimentisphaerales bacterium]|nr:hypothetical protein [Sedimentisphaerales bacterium]MBN2844241.1 hypothetical protein [Sedimentisphaerales bacterium]